jgi:hypothetical protein
MAAERPEASKPKRKAKTFLLRKTKGMLFEGDARLPLVGGGAGIVN